jgi:serine/threonine protein kinase/tetratricopeptide (TPR) repeat protein
VSTQPALDRARTGTAPSLTSPAPSVSVPSTKPGGAASGPPETVDFASKRGSRVGTAMRGTEGLPAPGPEKVRLVAGKVVPGTRYRILRWLGEGGMGVVYAAEHIDIERQVALKILRFDLSQLPQMVQVFKDEARAAGKLGSQHVVEIYDFGELEDGRLFFAMELLDGTDLVAEEPGQALEPGRVIGILRQVCKGLLTAHRKGVVHRDVKPDNIITTSAPDRQRQLVKIVDFGISAMLAAGPLQRGGIAGTPHYMAPEQILGQPFDGRLDVYALGCTAFELLTGDPPFDAGTIEELLRMHLDDAPPKLRSRRPELPPALEAVVARCLAKDPLERFADMADLEAALCEAQIEAGLITPWDDLPLPEIDDVDRKERIRLEMPSVDGLRPRRRLLWPVVAGTSSLLAVALGAFLAFGRGATDEDKVIVEGLVNDARAAASRMEWLPEAIGRIEELEALEGSADRLGERHAAELRREFAATLSAHGDRLWDSGNELLAREYYLSSLVFHDDQGPLLQRLALPPAVLSDYIQRARRGELTVEEQYLAKRAHAEVADDPEQRELLLDAVDSLEASLDPSTRAHVALRRRADPAPPPTPVDDPPPPPDIPDTAELEAALQDALREPESATGDGPVKKKDKRSKLAGNESAELGAAQRDPARAAELAQQGLAALRSGRRSEAATLFNQAIAFDNRNGDALMGLSDIYFDTGEDRKAILYAERAVKASPSSQQFRLKLGDAYFKALRYQDALSQYQEAKKRGSTRADDRIARVQAKLGK